SGTAAGLQSRLPVTSTTTISASRLCQYRKSVNTGSRSFLFDNPVGAAEQRQRHVQTERLGGVDSLSRCEISITRARVASLSTSLSASARLVASRFASHSSNR